MAIVQYIFDTINTNKATSKKHFAAQFLPKTKVFLSQSVCFHVFHVVKFSIDHRIDVSYTYI